MGDHKDLALSGSLKAMLVAFGSRTPCLIGSAEPTRKRDPSSSSDGWRELHLCLCRVKFGGALSARLTSRISVISPAMRHSATCILRVGDYSRWDSSGDIDATICTTLLPTLIGGAYFYPPYTSIPSAIWTSSHPITIRVLAPSEKFT